MNVYLGLVLCCILATGCTQNMSVAVVDMQTVFDQFDYTKELKSEFEEKNQKMKISLDSMYQELVILNNHLSQSKDEDLAKVFATKEAIYNRQLAANQKQAEESMNTSDEKILNQINQYLTDYSKANHLDLILGKQSADYSVIYAGEVLNHTEEVVEYINKRYNNEG